MKLIKQGGLITFSRILQYALSFVFTFLVAKFYGAKKLGDYVFLYSLVSLLTPLISLGGKQGLMYYLPIWGNKSGLKFRMSNLIITSLIGTLAIGVFIWFLLVQFDKYILMFFENDLSSLSVFWWFSSIIIFEGLNQLFTGIFRGLKDYNYFSIGLFITTFFRIILLLILYILSVNFNIIVLAYLGGAVLTTLFYVIAAVRINVFSGFKINTFKYYFLMVRKFSPVVITGLILVFQDKFVPLFIKYFLNSTDVGVYSVIIKIASLSSFFLISLNMLISPLISELFGKNKLKEIENIYSLSIRLLAFGNYMFVLIVIIFGHFILSFFGNEFEIGYGVLLIICLGQLVNAITGSSSQIITMMGKPKALTIFSLIALILSLIVMFIFTPLFGLYGVAIGTASSLMVYNVLSARYITKEFKIKAFTKKSLLYFLSQLSVLAVFYLLFVNVEFSNMLVKFLLLFVGMGSLFIIHLKLFWKKDIELLIHIKK